MLVWQRKGESHARVYAFRGWGDATAVSEANRARLGRRRYRERFGIETSYRQKNQARGYHQHQPRVPVAARGRGPAVAPGVGVPDARIARARGLAPTAWVAQFPLAEMLDWLTQRIRSRYPRTRCITLPHNTLTTNATP
ncbi:hypothetical protein J8F10_05650 [Gemmata sp. G18]|uniref:Uncharacterized protein n=1 Tax=Gemmata palustris TaxID=2822762 RepID=A0ABS5BM42_9BACT|nr:hypothetical protein [Gemmata palustris]MBP3954767.1 hypothetical protein [Gemmata palustris]